MPASRLPVLEPNRRLRIFGGTAVLAGAGALLALFGLGFAPGIFGIHLVLFGLLALVGGRFRRLRAQRRHRRVEVTAEGLCADGVPIAPRAEIVRGYYQPRTTSAAEDGWLRRRYGSSIRLLGRWGILLAEVECDPADGEALLTALGLGVGQARASFHGGSPLFATTGRGILVIWGALLAGALLGGLGAGAVQVVALSPFVILALVLAAMRPTRIEIGVDGIAVRWYGRPRFFPMDRIRAIRAGQMPMEIELELVDGETVAIYTDANARTPRNIPATSTVEHRAAVLARMQAAFAAFQGRAPTEAARLVARPAAGSATEWLARLARLRDGDAGYRQAAVREDDLWSVVEDPALPEDARAGAALVLQPGLDAAGRERLRIASVATASPKLRVLLDRATAGDALAELEAAALAVVAEEPARRRRRR